MTSHIFSAAVEPDSFEDGRSAFHAGTLMAMITDLGWADDDLKRLGLASD